jgi:hypothetical protein
MATFRIPESKFSILRRVTANTIQIIDKNNTDTARALRDSLSAPLPAPTTQL